jgi:hypothetical protein
LSKISLKNCTCLSSIREEPVSRLAMTTMRSCIYILLELLRCRKYKVTNIGMENSFISQQASTNLITLKLFTPYLQIRQIKLTSEFMVYLKPQTEQLNARVTSTSNCTDGLK